MTDVFQRPAMIAAIGVAIALVTGMLWLALASLHDAPVHQRSATITVPGWPDNRRVPPGSIQAQLMPYYGPIRSLPGHVVKPHS
jgi:hypothetical protein